MKLRLARGKVNEMKHSKGPWTINNLVITCDDNLTVCELYGYDNHKADAQLIAAAPDMLKALEHIQNELYPGEHVKHSKDAIRLVNDAIKKAKGEL